MRKIVLIMVACILICAGAYRWGDMNLNSGKQAAMEGLYIEVLQFMFPSVYTYEKSKEQLVYADISHFFIPSLMEFQDIDNREPIKEEIVKIEIEQMVKDPQSPEGESVQEESIEASGTLATLPKLEKKNVINRAKLQEFDYLRHNFFQVDNTTTVGSDLLNAENLLGKNLTIANKSNGPQILIYHTHSQEGYKDSVPGDPSTSIVGVGDYLEVLLEQKYGVDVLHHKGVYDLPERDNAYSMALPNLETLLKENPTIEVVIDLHRDGVAENRHLVTEVNGKPTAKIMFFNGLCKTTAQGPLEYLPNPYIADNLAFSFQMQLAAEEYFPGLSRKIYLKGYRYNLHLCPKSILVEVGAQTNTFEEAKNAMEPFADILGKVLYNDDSK